eukprot:206697_1
MDLSDENTYFEWKISNYWMQKWKKAKDKDAFFSPAFNTIGAEWELKIFPNGWDTNGTGIMYIRCKSIKTDEKEIMFCHYIAIDALNHCQIHFEGKTIENDGGIECDAPFKWHDIQNQSAITIVIKLWRTGSIEKNEARLVSNIYSERMTKLKDSAVNLKSVTLRNTKNNVLVRNQYIQCYQQTITSLKREKEGIESHLKTVAMRDLKKQEQIIKLQKEVGNLEHIQLENSKLKEENEIMKAKLAKVAMKQVKTFVSEKEMEISKNKMETQNEFDGKLKLDEKRLNEWKIDSMSIKNELQKEQELDDRDDSNTHLLLDRFIECKALCDKQQIR